MQKFPALLRDMERSPVGVLVKGATLELEQLRPDQQFAFGWCWFLSCHSLVVYNYLCDRAVAKEKTRILFHTTVESVSVCTLHAFLSERNSLERRISLCINEVMP